jgi:hypothetical protein
VLQNSQGHVWVTQAGRLANKLLEKRLKPPGYSPAPHTHGLWRHDTKPIQFALVVDDFGIEYEERKDAKELVQILKDHYKAVSEDWEGTLFCGITLAWDYENKTVNRSMPGYMAKVLLKFQHPQPKHPEHQPAKHNPPQYEAKVQMTEPKDNPPCSTPRASRNSWP